MKAALENTLSSSFPGTHFHYSVARSRRWVMQPEETIKLSSDYSTSRTPPPPSTRLVSPLQSLPVSRRNTSHMTHLSLYLCPEYLCGHLTGQKGRHCFPQHPFQSQHPPSLPFSAPFHHQALKVTAARGGGKPRAHTHPKHMLCSPCDGL